MNSVPANITRCSIRTCSEHAHGAKTVRLQWPISVRQYRVKAIDEILDEVNQLALTGATLTEEQENFLGGRLLQAPRLEHYIKMFHHTHDKFDLLSFKSDWLLRPRRVQIQKTHCTTGSKCPESLSRYASGGGGTS